VGQMDARVSIFLVWGILNVSKQFVMGQSKWLLAKGNLFFGHSSTPSPHF